MFNSLAVSTPMALSTLASFYFLYRANRKKEHAYAHRALYISLSSIILNGFLMINFNGDAVLEYLGGPFLFINALVIAAVFEAQKSNKSGNCGYHDKNSSETTKFKTD